MCISCLHKLGIIYRDFKPENIILDINGHIRLVDFGLSKTNNYNSTTGCFHLCGTIHYLSPEMLNNQEYGNCVDWWALGIIIYEMFCKKPPWFSENNEIAEMKLKIINEELSFPSYCKASYDAQKLISQLLNKNKESRLCCGELGNQEIRKHSFFKGLNWEKFNLGKATPPFKPTIPKNLDEPIYIEPEFKNVRATFGLFKNEYSQKNKYKLDNIFRDKFEYFE